jgi:hypothetical protein
MVVGEGFVICVPCQWMGEGVFSVLRRREDYCELSAPTHLRHTNSISVIRNSSPSVFVCRHKLVDNRERGDRRMLGTIQRSNVIIVTPLV